jgi:hypothetical protein
MHTLIVLGFGFALLGVCALTGHVAAGAHGIATGLLVFLPLWLLGAAINMYVGVKKAGYSIADEAPIFVVIFAVPAAVAGYAWWRLR